MAIESLNGQPNFDPREPDVLSHSEERGPGTGEPKCIMDGARDGSIEIGTRCLVDQCEVVCTGTDQSAQGCAEFARELAQFVIYGKKIQ